MTDVRIRKSYTVDCSRHFSAQSNAAATSAQSALADRPIAKAWLYAGGRSVTPTILPKKIEDVHEARASMPTLGSQMRPTPQACAEWITSNRRGPMPSRPGYRPCGFARTNNAIMTNTAITMAQSANLLTAWTGSIVQDTTGLPGYFDVDLNPMPVRASSVAQRRKHLALALRKQLGLTLEPCAASVDLLMVDHAERPKTDSQLTVGYETMARRRQDSEMRMRPTTRLLTISFGLATAAWLFSARDVPKPHAISGTVRDWQPGEFISVTRGPYDPVGITFSLRNAVYDDEPRSIRIGSRVTVWYNVVGERRPLASRVKLSN